jgi:hypothetical protein
LSSGIWATLQSGSWTAGIIGAVLIGTAELRFCPVYAALGFSSNRIAVTVGSIGTAIAQRHLRNILAYLDVRTLGQPEAFIQAKEGLFDETGKVGAGSRDFMQGGMDCYIAWVKQHTIAPFASP